MSQAPDPWNWNVPSFWEWLIGIAVAIISFLGGLWAKSLMASYAIGAKTGEIENLRLRLSIIEEGRRSEAEKIDRIADTINKYPVTAAGVNQGFDARIIALSDRILRIESHYDDVIGKIDSLTEKVAAMPTRAEWASGMDGLARRLDAIASRG